MAEESDLVVRCLDCNEEGPPTVSQYNSMIKMTKHSGHRIRFVDKESGQVKAKTGMQAVKEGLIGSKGPVEDTAGLEFTEQGDALVPMKVSLPSSILTLYFYAKLNKLTEHENVISFLCEYAQVGFIKAHNLGLTLAPIEQAAKAGDGDLKGSIDGLKETLADFMKKMGTGVPAAEAPAGVASPGGE